MTMTGINDQQERDRLYASFDVATARAEFEVKEMMRAKHLETFGKRIQQMDKDKYLKLMQKMFDLALQNPYASSKDRKQLIKAYEMNAPVRSVLAGIHCTYA